MFIKTLVQISLMFYIQIDGTCRLNDSGWVLIVIAIYYVRHDVAKGCHVRMPLPILCLITCTECKLAIVYLCTTFKNLPKNYFRMNAEIIPVTMGQDILIFTRDSVIEVWLRSKGLLCTVHIE